MNISCLFKMEKKQSCTCHKQTKSSVNYCIWLKTKKKRSRWLYGLNTKMFTRCKKRKARSVSQQYRCAVEVLLENILIARHILGRVVWCFCCDSNHLWRTLTSLFWLLFVISWKSGNISRTIPKLKDMEEGLVNPHWLFNTRTTPSFP